MPQREVVTPANPHPLYEMHSYSPAVRAGDLLFVSGQVGARQDGSPEPDITKQAELAFENLRAVLQAAGGSFADIVDVTFFMVDPDAIFPDIFPIIGRYFGDSPPPSVTAVGVTWLAGFQFEIKVVASIPAAG